MGRRFADDDRAAIHDPVCQFNISRICQISGITPPIRRFQQSL